MTTNIKLKLVGLFSGRHVLTAMVAVVGALVLAPSAGAFGSDNSAWKAYYKEPSNESTWEPFCEGGGGHVKAHGDGVMACGPTNEGNEIEIPGPGLTKGISTPGFQCVELSERFLYVTHGWGTIGANGAQVAERYAAAHGVPLIANGTAGIAPHVGDVMSFSNENFANLKEAGHTGVVIASNVNSSGNGTITLLSENISGDGNESTFAVTGWKVASVFSFTASEWVQSGSGGGPLAIATKELPRGTPGHRYVARLNATGGAGGYKWILPSGALQAGLYLTSSGEISGTPKRPGTASVSVTVTDAEGHERSATLVVKVGAEHEELFARASNGSVWHDYFIPSSSSWSGWGSLGSESGATLQSSVSVGYNQGGSEELFARASNGSVWHDYFTPGTSAWSGWGLLGSAAGATLQSDVSVGYNASGSEELFAGASNGSVWHDYFIPGSGSWSGWTSLGRASGVTLQSDISVGYNASGSEELFARASDGSVWHDYFIPGSSSWSGWGSLGSAAGATLQSDISVGYNQGGCEELFARASNGSVWHDYFIPGSSSWSGWGSLGRASGVKLQANISVGYNASGSEELFARASGGSVWHDYFIPGSSSWSGWGSLGSAAGVTLQSDVSVGYNQGGSEELFARASNGSAWHDYFIPGSSSWSGWGSLGSAAGATLQSDVSTTESATP